MEHYLDNSATTWVYPQVADKILELLTVKYGNPSSLHTKGMEAEEELNTARHIIAKSVGAQDKEIYFTSGGTEANNLAIMGVANAMKRRGNKIVTTAFEHSSVYETMKQLENQGFEVTYIPPDSNGNICANDFAQAIDDKTILVSIMAVNNELGSILPVEEVARIIKNSKSPALMHCDCVQAYCKIPLKFNKLGVDLATISAHKIHGPKGVGALYIKNGIRILPNTFGGEQEKKIRPGTEALPLIAGFGKSVELANIEKDLEYVTELNNYAKGKLLSLPDITLNSPLDALPYILNISVKGIRSETMLHFLEEKNIFVSSGSACAKGKASHVLSSMKLDKNISDSAIRISFSNDNTTADIDALCDGIAQGLQTLIRR